MDRFIWGRWEMLICGVEVVDAVDAAEVMVARRRLDVRVEIVTSNRRTRTRFSLMSGAGIYIMENDGGYILRIGGVRNVEFAKSGGVTLIVYFVFCVPSSHWIIADGLKVQPRHVFPSTVSLDRRSEPGQFHLSGQRRQFPTPHQSDHSSTDIHAKPYIQNC